MKRRYDTNVWFTRFKVGSEVWLRGPSKKRGKSRKIMKHWYDTYVVVNHLSDVEVHILRSRRHKPKVVHVNRLKHHQGSEPLDWFNNTTSPEDLPIQVLTETAHLRNFNNFCLVVKDRVEPQYESESKQ